MVSRRNENLFHDRTLATFPHRTQTHFKTLRHFKTLNTFVDYNSKQFKLLFKEDNGDHSWSLHTAWQKLIDNMHPAWLHVKPAELKMNAEGECVWNQSLVLFITFEAIALTTVPASWCPLHDLNAKGQRSVYKDLRRPLEHLQNTCVFGRFRGLPYLDIPNTRVSSSLAKYGVTICGGKVELILRSCMQVLIGRSFLFLYYKTETLSPLGY